MSFFRTYIDKEIQEELFNRIDSLNFKKSPEGILNSVQSSVQHQFVKSCWARTSVVLSKGEVISLNSNLLVAMEARKIFLFNILAHYFLLDNF